MEIKIKITEDNYKMQVESVNEVKQEIKETNKSPIQIFDIGLANILLKQKFLMTKIIEKSTGNIYLFKHAKEIRQYSNEWAKQKKTLYQDALQTESEN